MTDDIMRDFLNYTACDISDALLKLGVPGAGFLPNICKLKQACASFSQSGIPCLFYPVPITKYGQSDQPTIARAQTVLFGSKTRPEDYGHTMNLPELPINSRPSVTEPLRIPANYPLADLCHPNSVMVLKQPKEQNCAVLGGIMVARMKYLGVRGVVVEGRVRDITELEACKMPIWASNVSSVGMGAEAKPIAVNVEMNIGGTKVNTGDVIFLDPANYAAVCIPLALVERVRRGLPRLCEMDERVMEEVRNGETVFNAFKKYRYKISL